MFVARDCPLGQGESRPHHWPLLRPSASYVGFQYLSTLTVCGGIACRGSKKPPGEIEMFNAVRFTQKIAIQTFQAYSLLLITLSSAALTGCSGLVTANNSGGGTPPPLTISGVQAATPTTGGFQVSWSTNVAANSVVDYGTTANYGSSTATNSAMVTSHQVALTSLTAGTLYHFRARSTDTSSSSASSPDMTFSTATTVPSITSLNPTSGPVGTSVTIVGTNFGATQGTSTVTFNGKAAAATSWSATSITAPVPSGATTGNVVVTVGGVGSNGVGFTVPVPAPSITSLNPTTGFVGTSVIIVGANFGATRGTSTVKFNATSATPTSWSATSITAPVPSGATTGNVVVTVGGMASNGVRFT